jgi:DtxR family Mn-dependent transcriptional regulator
VSHDVDLADQDVEELAEELWTLGEEGSDRLDDLRRISRVDAFDAALAALALRGLARVFDASVSLTTSGKALAERQVRRHRLAEALFTTVLEVRDDAAVNRTACVMEHVLGAGLTDSICAFLGHPKACPHGKSIPAGDCCRSLTLTVEPLVQPLLNLPVGQVARVVYIVARDRDRLVKLSNLGLMPGARVQLRQASPSAVVTIGETTIALDPAIAGEIYVRKVADFPAT